MEGTVSEAPDSAAGEGGRSASRVVPAEQQATEELARLEALLAERAAECRALRVEAERRGELCRSLSSRLEHLVPAAPSAVHDTLNDEMAQLLSERDRAQERALDAQAECALLTAERDELQGHLAAQVDHVGSDDVEVEQARLLGARRGLLAALAEAQEARDVLDARLLLALQDLDEARAQRAIARREAAEHKDQTDLEGIRAHATAAKLAQFEHALDVSSAERAGLDARATETERAFATIDAAQRASRERMAAMRDDLLTRQTETAELRLANAAYLAQLNDADVRSRVERQRSLDLAAEIAERDHLIARVETDLSLAQVEIDGLRRGVESLDAQREATRDAVEDARTSVAFVRETARHEQVRAEERVDEARHALHDARATLRELLGVLGVELLGEADAEHGPVTATRSEQETLPGVAIDLNDADSDAVPTFGREATELSEARARVAALLETLENERGRQRTVESTLRTLRPLVRDPEVVRRLDELLTLLAP